MAECGESFTELNNDDLKLGENFILDIPKEIIFPTELNTFLKDKVQYLVHENGMLKKNLSEITDELSDSKNQVESLTEKMKKFDAGNNEYVQVGSVARSKIIELSRKLREKSCEVEVSKRKYLKLEQELVDMNKQNIQCQEIEEKPARPKCELEQEIKTLTDKVAALNARIIEDKNSTHSLKNDLKLANKILQEEIGDTYENLQQISLKEGWKGRAHIISDLQHKNNELREKLKMYQEKESKTGDNSAVQRRSLLERKLEKSSKQIDAVRAENEELRKRIEILRIRHRNCEIETNLWKNKFANLTDQMEKDRELINSLSSQNALNQNCQNDLLKRRDTAIQKLQRDLKEIKTDLKKEKCKVEQIVKLSLEKDAEMENIKECIQSTSKYLDPTEDTPKSNNTGDERQIQKLNAERLRLVELTELVSQKLQHAKQQLTTTENLYRHERQKAAKLEAKVARMQLGDSTERGSSYSNGMSKFGRVENLEFKLELAEETIKSLQTKLEIEKREREADLQEFGKIIRTGCADPEK